MDEIETKEKVGADQREGEGTSDSDGASVSADESEETAASNPNDSSTEETIGEGGEPNRRTDSDDVDEANDDDVVDDRDVDGGDHASSDADDAAEDEPDDNDEAADDQRFQFVRELGRGVLGEAYEVLDEVRAEPVVLKVFIRCRPRDPERFRLEFESLARLEHPSLVAFHHLVDPMSDTNVALEERFGIPGLAFTQEFVHGQNLTAWLRRPPSEEETLRLEQRRSPTTGDIPLPDDVEVEETEDGVEADAGETDAGDDDGAPETGPTPESSGVTESSREVEYSGGLDSKELRLHGEKTDDLSDLDPRDTLPGEDATASKIIDEMAQDPPDTPVDLILLRLERIIPKVVDGLKHLHKFHKVHGNLRPSNVLVSPGGDVTITDYGIVQGLAYDVPGSEDDETYPLMQAPENLPYVAPEVTGAEVTEESDRYALGCVLFEAIAGRSPFESLEWSKGKKPTLQPAPLAEYVPECPASWAELVDGLLRRDPEERPSLNKVASVVSGREARAVALPPTVVPEPDGFIGRTQLVERLRREAKKSADEQVLRLVMLEGETGVGKSTLIKEIAHWLSRRGWAVVRGRCFDRESVVYQGWHEVATSLSRMCEALPPAIQEEIESDREKAAVIFPELSRYHDPPGDGAGRLAGIQGLRNVLRRLSEERPILLCLEDLHWASWDTSSLLIDLFSETEGVRCMMLGSWRTDADRAGDHLLQHDLDLSLIDVLRVPVRGFSRDEAREYVASQGADLPVEVIRHVLQAGRLNPRLLQELIFDTRETRGAVDEIEEEGDEATVDPVEVIQRVFEGRVERLSRRDSAIVQMLAVSSGPLKRDILCHAVESELGSSVLPAEASEEGILEGLVDLEEHRLIRRVAATNESEDGAAYSLIHDLCRSVVLERMSEGAHARYAGRIADTYGALQPEDTDLRFEYELRAGRVGRAVEPAVKAARTAEERFAFHRAAKLWRWLTEHSEQLPEHFPGKPFAELARVEHLAGQHAEAARLYSVWAEDIDDAVERSRVKLREARAWLQAGDIERTIDAIDAGLRSFGESYEPSFFSRLVDLPARLWTATSRWTASGGDDAEAGRASEEDALKSELYYMAADVNAWLASERGRHFEACLSGEANRTGDARLLGMERLKLAEYHAGPGIERRRDRAIQWVEEADAFFEQAGDEAWRAEAALERAVLHLRYGEFSDAAHWFREARARGEGCDDRETFSRRQALYWEGIFCIARGQLSEAERHARRILHVYRGDRFAAVHAYEVLSRVALLRGDTARAQRFIDAGRNCIEWGRPSLSSVVWARLQTMLNIALGRPEVAVGQLDVFLDRLVTTKLSDLAVADAEAHLALGQALCALAERQRMLGEPRQDETRSRLKQVRKRLEKRMSDLDAGLQAEVGRFFARTEVLRERPKRALKEIESVIDALEGTAAPLQIAKSAEAHGIILAKKERPEARSLIEQARDAYRQFGCSFPLVLEGWPVPKSIASLREDTD